MSMTGEMYCEGIKDTSIEFKEICEHLLNSGMGKKKSLEWLIKVADKKIKESSNV